jgi:hypothetical protein
MRISLFIFACAVLYAGCSKKEKLPADLLPQKQMKAILWDLMRADKFLSDYVLTRDTSIDPVKKRLGYYNRIFSLHKISRDKFQESFSYYQSHPALFKMVMDSISTPPLNDVQTPVLVK